MRLVQRSDVRVEEIDGEAIVLDRSGSVVHHASGDSARVLRLVGRGIDEAKLPADLAPAVAELVDAGVLTTSDWSRRRMLKTVGGGLAGAGLITVALASPAAAASGSVTVSLNKSGNGNPTLASLCLTGGTGARRGSAVFNRTETPAEIEAIVTITSGGPSVESRDVYMLQSSSTSCLVETTTTTIGTWDPNIPSGPQTFVASIVPTATRFVIALQEIGGTGNDSWASELANLP